SRQSNPSLNSHGTTISRIGCSSSTRRTRGRLALGRTLARVPVSVLTELINLLNLSRAILWHSRYRPLCINPRHDLFGPTENRRWRLSQWCRLPSAPDAYINHHRNMVAKMSPLAERPDFNRSQTPTFRDEYVVDVKRLVLMTVKVVGRVRFGSL